MDKNKWVRQDLQNFTPYHAKTPQHTHKLDANESPYTLSENVRNRMLAWFQNEENLNIYPDTDSTSLRQAIATFWGVSPEHVVCSVGSDQMIDYITKVFLNAGEGLLAPVPTFSMYGIAATLNGGKLMSFSLDAQYNTTASQIVAAVNAQKPKLLFLCTPNNPTGNSVSMADILSVLAQVDIPVVVDEAYAEFATQTMIPHIHDYDNLIVLRTFSKAYGLAGARIGYAVANESLINAINLVKAPYNVPVLSQVLAEAVLADHPVYQARIHTLNQQRAEMEAKLEAFPFLTVFPSCANFLFIESTTPIVETLAKAGILVRLMSADGEKECIRLSIGTVDQNQAVLSVLNDIASKEGDI